MRLSLPTPSGIIGTAASVAGGVSSAVEGVGDAVDLVPRAAELISRVGALLDRVGAVVDRAEAAIVMVESVVASAQATVAGAGATIVSVDTVAVRADALVDTASTVATKADKLVAGATGALDTTNHLLGDITPIARALMPSAKRFAETLQPREVDAAIALVERMPTLLNHLDEDVLPLLRQLDHVGPDVHEILETVQDLREVLSGLPGVGLLKKLGDRKDDSD